MLEAVLSKLEAKEKELRRQRRNRQGEGRDASRGSLRQSERHLRRLKPRSLILTSFTILRETRCIVI